MPVGWAQDAYDIAADALAKAEKKQGSLRGILYSMLDSSGGKWKLAYALANETQKFVRFLTPAIEDCRAVQQLCKDKENDRQNWWVVRVLTYDVVLGSGGGRVRKRRGTVSRTIHKNKGALAEAITNRFGNWKVKSDLLRGDVSSEVVTLKRFARINRIKLMTKTAIAQLTADGFEVAEDDLIPDLVVCPPSTDLHVHPLVLNGSLILQDKGSSMAAEALAPKADWLILDACAAPGNKTTHLASMLSAMSSRRRPCVIALDRDARRFKLLQDRVANAGAEKMIQCIHEDFLRVDPLSKPFSEVDAILLDPSCSGSGLHNRIDVSTRQSEEEGKRLQKLAGLQKTMLKAALGFPKVSVVLNAEENEEVVAEALSAAAPEGWHLTFALPNWPSRGDSSSSLENANMCIRTNPGRDNTNGFFLARFERELESSRLSKAEIEQSPSPLTDHADVKSDQHQSSSNKRKREAFSESNPDQKRRKARSKKSRKREWKRGVKF